MKEDEPTPEELEAMEELLRIDAGTYREVVREARESRDAADDLALEALRRQVRPRRLWPFVAGLAAAAGIVMLTVLVAVTQDEDRPADPTGWLTDEREAWPEGEVGAWGDVLWKLPLAPGQEYRFELRDAQAAAGAPPLVLREGLTEARWSPPEDFRWPARVSWRVLVMESGLPTGASVAAEASLKE